MENGEGVMEIVRFRDGCGMMNSEAQVRDRGGRREGRVSTVKGNARVL